MVERVERQMILIEWVDSRQPTHGWQFLEDMETPKICKCVSVGWLLDEDAERVVIAANRTVKDKNEQVMGVMVIPVSSILKKTPIKIS